MFFLIDDSILRRLLLLILAMRGWLCEHEFVVKMAAVRILQFHTRQWLNDRVLDVITNSSICSPQDDSGVMLSPEHLSTEGQKRRGRPSVYYTPPQYLSHSVSIQTPDVLADEEEDDSFDLHFETPRTNRRPLQHRRRVRLSVDQYLHDPDITQMFTATCLSTNKDSSNAILQSSASDVCSAAASWIGNKMTRITSQVETIDEESSLCADDFSDSIIEVNTNEMEKGTEICTELEISLDNDACHNTQNQFSVTAEELRSRLKLFGLQSKRFHLAGSFRGMMLPVCANSIQH